MNPAREQMLKNREKRDMELFEKIKNNPRPDVLDLWALSEERFIEWRRLHDFPTLLNHFDKTLLLFNEWKKENNLVNELIISTGFISPFLEHKKWSKDKALYLTKQVVEGKESTIVAYKDMGKQQNYLGRTFHFELIQKFKSYLDWLKEKGKYQEILYINSRSAVNTPQERVFIHADVYALKSDFELLKMGGVDLPVNEYGILFRGKRLEFVNLSGLILTGEVSFGEEGNLSCSYCACDNWIAENFSMGLLDLQHCTLGNFKLINSEILQWSLYDTYVSGDFITSKLYRVDIVGGSFNPVIQDCTLSQTHLRSDPNIQDENFLGYRMFKKIYQGQGDDDIARYYFVRENEFIRKRLKGFNFFTKSLSYYYWEYGRRPHRIIYISLAIIVLFGFIYWIATPLISINSSNIKAFTFWDSFYFSTITFTTLGYGDFSPMGWLRIFSSIEAFSGVVNMGFLIAGYSNNKY